MTKTKHIDLFTGTGTRLRDREQGMAVPDYEPFAGDEDPSKYIASENLKSAVNVALYLGQPLLITGKPGTGKTRLAAAVAWELDLPLLEFHTKTTSTASDLFYHYDAVRRFQDAHSDSDREKDVSDYITCEALGAAILLTNPTERAKTLLAEKYRNTEPTRSVVLIDEIDKAPRDLPNDVLDEVESMRFRIKETDWETFTANPKLRPILILTSNSEKNLPDAFLRRCVFHHIPFPEDSALREIVSRRFSDQPAGEPRFSAGFIEKAVDHFMEIRDIGLKKKPATAECIAWISVLNAMDLNLSIDEKTIKPLIRSYSALAKNKGDLYRMIRFLKDKVKTTGASA